MKTFEQWIQSQPVENRVRTGLGIYPPAYVSAQYPPLYFTPYKASALVDLERNHGVKKKKKKQRHKKKKNSN